MCLDSFRILTHFTVAKFKKKTMYSYTIHNKPKMMKKQSDDFSSPAASLLLCLSMPFCIWKFWISKRYTTEPNEKQKHAHSQICCWPNANVCLPFVAQCFSYWVRLLTVLFVILVGRNCFFTHTHKHNVCASGFENWPHNWMQSKNTLTNTW